MSECFEYEDANTGEDQSIQLGSTVAIESAQELRLLLEQQILKEASRA